MFCVLLVLSAVGACSSDRIDRAQAVQQVLTDSGGRMTRAQAECFVDEVLDQIGSGPLRPGADVPPDQLARLTTIRVDCVGVADLGTAGTSDGTVVSVPELAGPKVRGDDAALDALWDQCVAGYGQACDDLFDRAVLGSQYEGLAVTCGGRTREERCATVYPEPGVVLPSAAQATTTAPPSPP